MIVLYMAGEGSKIKSYFCSFLEIIKYPLMYTIWEFGYFIPATNKYFQSLLLCPTSTINSVAFERKVPELLISVVMTADNLSFKSV